FLAGGPLKAAFDTANTVVDVAPYPASLYHLGPDSFESQWPEFGRRFQAVQLLDEFQGATHSLQLTRGLTILSIVFFGVGIVTQDYFVYRWNLSLTCRQPATGEFPLRNDTSIFCSAAGAVVRAQQ